MIENVGTYNTNAIIVTVFSDDEYISMLTSSSGIAYAIAGATAATETPISFSVAGDVPDGHIAQFESTLNDGENEWYIPFGIEADGNLANNHIQFRISRDMNKIPLARI